MCYIQRNNITNYVINMFHEYFGIQLGDQDKSWALHIAFRSCVESLRNWKKDKRLSMPFGIFLDLTRTKKSH